ncbi:MAG: Gfo/Idh/MocA family oxidoreductase [Ruminococcaceae bacterium]|nr:Gfo/Idh/MocA family oxidoreductase [Oscillospiraceae bacterium]
MKKVKIGIIGVGGIGKGRHLREMLQCADADVVALCDIDPARLEEARELAGLSKEQCYTDYRALIADANVEAVEVCTPNYLHAEMAIAVLNAGKYLNLEKPVAMNYREAIAITEAERTSAAFGMTSFTYRFMPAVRYALHLMKDRIIGDVVGLNITYAKDSAFWEDRRLEWRFVKEYAASGVAGDLGVHLVDLAQILAGEIRELCAITETTIKERKTLDGRATAPVETDDICFFLARFQSGAVGTFHVTRSAIGHKNTIRYDVYGTKGSISFLLNKQVPDSIILCTGEGDPKTFETKEIAVPKEFYLSQAQGFVNAIKGERDAIFPTLSDGAQGQRVIDAILDSAQQHRWVSL